MGFALPRATARPEPGPGASPFGAVPLFVGAAAGPVAIQPKLRIGAPRDRHELEADRVAAEVVGVLRAPAVTQPSPPAALQRKETGEGEGEAEKEAEGETELGVGGKISSLPRPPADLVQGCDACCGTCDSPDFEATLERARDSGGEPFPRSAREPMERAFGADFSGVTIHRDRQADQLNQTIRSRAFTTGQDVFFRQGEYDPSTRGGQELLAHELTHVVQQTGGTGGSLVQRACTRAECGGDPDPEPPMEVDEVADEDDGADMLMAKPQTGAGSAFLDVAAVAPPAGARLVQRAAIVTGNLNTAAAFPTALVGAPPVVAPAYGLVTANNTATQMTVQGLHRQANGTGVGGKRPTNWTLFQNLAGNPFCQGHFLSQKLSGRGEHKNLAPFTRSLNGMHSARVEQEVIDWTRAAPGSDSWADYKVSANYKGNGGISTWAKNSYNGKSVATRVAKTNLLPGVGAAGGPFTAAGVAAADTFAHNWLVNYVDDTFPTSIDCRVTFIKKTVAGAYVATAAQDVNITNDF